MNVLNLAVLLLTVYYGAAQDEGCHCVYHYLCTKENNIITTGAGLIDVRIQCKCAPGCENVPPPDTPPSTCCRLQTNQTDFTTSQPFLTTRASYTTEEPLFRKCGEHNSNGIGYKTDPDPKQTAFGEFPWMIGVLNENGRYRCGGSLIHPSIVLTAAHCVVAPQKYKITAGEWNTLTHDELIKHQIRQVSSIKIHENFIKDTLQYDIALLYLESPVELAANVKTVCLPSPKTIEDTDDCYATGWGKSQFGIKNPFQPILKKVLLPMVNKSECQKLLRKTRLGDYFILNPTFVCAGGKKDVDTCAGDGGGPLVCPIKGTEDRYYQTGITSWGVDCNKNNVPGVYTDVAFLRNWIDNQVKANHFQTDFYEY